MSPTLSHLLAVVVERRDGMTQKRPKLYDRTGKVRGVRLSDEYSVTNKLGDRETRAICRQTLGGLPGSSLHHYFSFRSTLFA
jgi:hypothetical protein